MERKNGQIFNIKFNLMDHYNHKKSYINKRINFTKNINVGNFQIATKRMVA